MPYHGDKTHTHTVDCPQLHKRIQTSVCLSISPTGWQMLCKVLHSPYVHQYLNPLPSAAGHTFMDRGPEKAFCSTCIKRGASFEGEKAGRKPSIHKGLLCMEWTAEIKSKEKWCALCTTCVLCQVSKKKKTTAFDAWTTFWRPASPVNHKICWWSFISLFFTLSKWLKQTFIFSFLNQCSWKYCVSLFFFCDSQLIPVGEIIFFLVPFQRGQRAGLATDQCWKKEHYFHHLCTEQTWASGLL